MLCLLGLSACETARYYSQAVRGHSRIIFNQRPIDEWLKDEQLEAAQKQKLQLVQAALKYAEQELGLPSNGSYTKYVDTGRDYVVWNVIATPQYSISPLQQCFLVAGCVSYRGFYALDDAKAYADKLKQAGNDVYVGGVSAYSTLGWFADPLLNTMLRHHDDSLVSTLFHELAHQQVYLKGDTAFSESFATAVEEMGLQAWLQQKGQASQWQDYYKRQQAVAGVVAMILRHRTELGIAYKKAQGDATRLAAVKRKAFAALKSDYATLQANGGGTKGFDRWFASNINNASLVSFADYNTWVKAFIQLREDSASWADFYAQVEQLSKLNKGEREQALSALKKAVGNE